MGEGEVQRILVESSVLASVAYLPDATLQIEFRSGDIYHYTEVPPQIFQALLDAPSKGAYFNHYIRDHFPTHHLKRSSTQP